MEIDIKEVRRENLRTLVQQAAGQAAFARKVGTSSAYISQVLSKTVRGEVGDQFARKIEAALSLEPLWLDTDHSVIKMRTVSLYDLHDIAEISFHRELPKRLREPVSMEGRLSNLAFAYKYESDDMSPDIAPDSVLLIEPGIDPKPGMLVLIYAVQSDQAFVRKLRITMSGELEMKASDPSVSVEKLTENHILSGVVVELMIRKIFIKQ